MNPICAGCTGPILKPERAFAVIPGGPESKNRTLWFHSVFCMARFARREIAWSKVHGHLREWWLQKSG